MRIASLVWAVLTLVVCSLPLQARSPYAGLIVYALDNKAPFLLLEHRGNAGNVWAGFSARPGRAKGGIAKYLPGTSGEAKLLAGFAEALRRMIAESGQMDPTIEFTLP